MYKRQWLCVGFGIVLTVLTVIFCRNILELMGTPADIIDDAYAYLVVIFAGIPATFLYNMPVSYTHLDVYKRQLYRSCGSP